MADHTSSENAYQWSMLLLAVAVIALSLLLQVSDQSRVIVPGVNLTLPETCTFKNALGIGCPGCGLTRSFVSLARGDLAGAWRFNAIGIPLFVIVVLQIPYRLSQLWRIANQRPAWRPIRASTYGAVAFAVLLLVQWVYRNTLY